MRTRACARGAPRTPSAAVPACSLCAHVRVSGVRRPAATMPDPTPDGCAHVRVRRARRAFRWICGSARQGGAYPQVFARAGRACMRHAYGAHAMREAHTPLFPKVRCAKDPASCRVLLRLRNVSRETFRWKHAKPSARTLCGLAPGPHGSHAVSTLDAHGPVRYQRWDRVDPCDASVGFARACALPASGIRLIAVTNPGSLFRRCFIVRERRRGEASASQALFRLCYGRKFVEFRIRYR